MSRPRQSRRPVHGVLVADKPVGPSSTQFLGRVKFLFQAEKAGHGGTLDPMASGVLPILFGEATKFAQMGLDADKSYRAQIRLGVTTDSGDAEGQVLSQQPVRCTEAEVAAAVAGLVGEQDQIPPMHSALKVEGRPLYAYAREGVTLERKARRITVYAARLESCDLSQQQATVWISCSKGTYIRSLAQTLGERLGCGAHLSGLRRTSVADLALEHAVPLETMERCAQEGPEALAALLAPVDALVAHWPSCTLAAEAAQRLQHGAAVDLPPSSERLPEDALVRIFGPSHEFLGIAQHQQFRLTPHRLINTETSHAPTAQHRHHCPR